MKTLHNPGINSDKKCSGIFCQVIPIVRWQKKKIRNDEKPSNNKEITMRALTLFFTVLMIAVAGCSSSDINVEAEKAAIRQVDSDIVAALNAHNIDALLAFYAEDARMLPPGAPPIVGKAAIRDLANAFVSAGVVVTHNLEEVVVSKGGDLAYVSYSYELSFTGPEGSPITETGKDITIYKKANDGSWKLAIDMWSENEANPASTS
jgi:uncharacterized protein (TIGR02246 family)